MRSPAIPVPANIVGGAGRETEREFLRFLSISFASLRERGFYISFGPGLDYLTPKQVKLLTSKQRGGLGHFGPDSITEKVTINSTFKTPRLQDSKNPPTYAAGYFPVIA
jgi:hypothetical protein